MLRHRDDSKDYDFHMLLHLYGFSLLAQRTSRQDKSEELVGSWRSADKSQGLRFRFLPKTQDLGGGLSYKAMCRQFFCLPFPPEKDSEAVPPASSPALFRETSV